MILRFSSCDDLTSSAPSFGKALSSVAIQSELKTAEFRGSIAVKKIFDSDNPTISLRAM